MWVALSGCVALRCPLLASPLALPSLALDPSSTATHDAPTQWNAQRRQRSQILGAQAGGRREQSGERLLERLQGAARVRDVARRNSAGRRNELRPFDWCAASDGESH